MQGAFVVVRQPTPRSEVHDKDPEQARPVERVRTVIVRAAKHGMERSPRSTPGTSCGRVGSPPRSVGKAMFPGGRSDEMRDCYWPTKGGAGSRTTRS